MKAGNHPEVPAMRLSDIARELPEDVWALFEPILPRVVWAGVGRKPKGNRECLHGILYVLISGIGWELTPVCFPSYKTLQRRLKRWLQLDCFLAAWEQLARRYEQLRGINWDKVLLDGSKKPAKKGGEDTGPSPVDRSKCGPAIHLATDEHGMPLGAVITKAGANDGVQTQAVLESLVLRPPPPEVPVEQPDVRDLPRARADGAYGNRPTQQRAQAAGFRMIAPKRGQTRQPGVGRIRCAVERGHAFMAQFGRIARRLDRQVKRYLGWVQLAACIIPYADRTGTSSSNNWNSRFNRVII
jgi:transposase